MSFWEKGDPSPNPYGRPTKLVSQVLKDLKEAGAEAVSPGQVSDVISILLNLPKEMISKIAADQKLPILIQRTARRFVGSSDRDWDWVLSNNLDRAHGKARQSLDVGGQAGNPIGIVNLDAVSDAALDEALKILQSDGGKKRKSGTG